MRNAFEETPWKRPEFEFSESRVKKLARDRRPVIAPPVPNEELAEFLYEMFTTPAVLAERYSSDQLGAGFWFIFGVESSYCVHARQKDVTRSIKLAWIREIGTLYERLFANVCDDSLGHLSECGSNSVNGAVYMMWDMDCLPGRPDENDPDAEAMTNAVFEVLDRALEIDQAACQESALHGLGELHHWYPDRVRSVLRPRLQGRRFARSELADYAKQAIEGNVM
ncbi:MAG: hypothetical protein ACKVZJ_01290 [Phycisphaerales bacterium]